ncbi:MAG: AAA family ATPase [Planctomycetes bacterium]|nr:AAA family ATPase [Planctomycetota bacterium]
MSPEELHAVQEKVDALRQPLRRVLLGQTELIDLALVGFLARGHLLLEGLPGLGKTELVKAMSRLLGLEFRRIQFTPDLLPSDILGSPILEEDEQGRRRFVFRAGPIFGNLILADEINRASPKTQAALLEAMQERRVTVLGTTHELPQPFYVLATQNPIELEGTYPLPEAQLDRFTLKIQVMGVGEQVLSEIVRTRKRGEAPELETVLGADEIGQVLACVDRIFIHPALADHIGRIVAASHRGSEKAPESVKKHVRYGASPRGAIAIASAARALGLLRGKPHAGFEEVRDVAGPALAHRLVLDYTARLEGVDAPSIVRDILRHVGEVTEPLPAGIAS